MPEPNEIPLTKLGNVASKWTAYSAFATFLLYLFGYLALRFQLSTYGVATSLDVFDEKYMFAGSRFLVYLVSAVPNVLLIVFALVGIGYVPYKLLPASAKQRMSLWWTAWAAHPGRLALVGTLFALVFIQLVLRQCFVFGNLLFAKELPRYAWITSILMTGNDNLSLYFSGLVGGTLLSGALLFLALQQEAATALSKVLVGLLCFLVGVEFLLLPVNYGILIGSQQLPRVSDVSGNEKPQAGQLNWLVWEGKESMTFFVLETPEGNRAIVTIPRKETETQIVGYDRIFRVLFADKPVGTSQAPRETVRP
jgi:hypothetical protein